MQVIVSWDDKEGEISTDEVIKNLDAFLNSYGPCVFVVTKKEER